MRCHAGWQIVVLAWWQGLHEDLHATTQVLAELVWKPHVATQVPAQLVGLAAACERRWRLGWCGPGSGPAGVLGEGLSGGPARALLWRAVVPGKDLAGGLVALLGKNLVEDRCLPILV